MNPSKFKKNDRVRVKDNYFNSAKRGKEGTVLSVEVPSSFLSGLVAVKLDSGEEITLTEVSVELVEVKDTKPLEGSEIDRKDIKVGQTIRVSHVTEIGSYKQVSTKEGVVTRIKATYEGPHLIVQPEDSEITLSFGTSKEYFTLVKDAPEVDEIAETLKELKAGSVVQVEDNGFGNFVLTYVKTSLRDSINQQPLWAEHDSRYAATNRSVTEATVRRKIQSLDQILVKL